MSGSPPHITLRRPACAPACPPDTGASTKPTPTFAACAAISAASSADVVVWSTIVAPGASAPSAPSGPSSTARTSSSAPTHTYTTSDPDAACAGVAATRPGCSADQRAAVASVRLNTTVSKPARARWPAMGKPMVPRPTKATCISVLLSRMVGHEQVTQVGPGGRGDGPHQRRALRQRVPSYSRSRARLMIRFWISEVPSPMSMNGASR